LGYTISNNAISSNDRLDFFIFFILNFNCLYYKGEGNSRITCYRFIAWNYKIHTFTALLLMKKGQK
jgi:hypothetical protein